MASLVKLRGAIVEHVDPVQRWLMVSLPPWSPGDGRSLTLKVDEGAFVATKDHQLLKLEDFQVGHRISVIYSQQPDGQFLAKSVILERGTLRAAGLPAQR